eukprot:superscaffoldBa00000383_g4262
MYFILPFSIIPTTPVITEITTLLYLTIPLTFSFRPPPLFISRHRHRPLAAFLVFIIPIITLIISLTVPAEQYLYQPSTTESLLPSTTEAPLPSATTEAQPVPVLQQLSVPVLQQSLVSELLQSPVPAELQQFPVPELQQFPVPGLQLSTVPVLQ